MCLGLLSNAAENKEEVLKKWNGQIQICYKVYEKDSNNFVLKSPFKPDLAGGRVKNPQLLSSTRTETSIHEDEQICLAIDSGFHVFFDRRRS